MRPLLTERLPFLDVEHLYKQPPYSSNAIRSIRSILAKKIFQYLSKFYSIKSYMQLLLHFLQLRLPT